MSSNSLRGFILPLSVLLVLILTISGTSFFQHEFLEQRLARNEVDNQAAFYLANTGLERSRATMRIGAQGGAPSWTPILQGKGPYLVENPPDPLLCGRAPCLIPPFGALVRAQDPPPNPPFESAFARGEYAVRAFNNLEDEEGDEDTDQRLTLRAAGVVGGERKTLEVTVFATSGLKLINCDKEAGFGEDCPTREPFNFRPEVFPGREPASFPRVQLPTFDESFYRSVNSFPVSWGLRMVELPGPVEFRPARSPRLEERTYYLIHGDVKIRDSADQVVIFAEGQIDVQAFNSDGSILIGLGGVIIGDGGGAISLEAPIPFPALISANGITIDGAASINGNMWSFGPVNLINANHIEGTITAVNGPVNAVHLLEMTDQPTPAQEAEFGRLAFYIPLPGFLYPQGQSTPGIVPGTWREIE